MVDTYFDDFTEKNYLNLLKKAKQNYTFTTFDNYLDKKNSIIWRHDIDFSVHRALVLAKIENAEAVRSIYFVQLSSDFYNIFELKIASLLKEIYQLGHHIGLHFDAQKYAIKSNLDLENWLTFESDILKKLIGCEINCFSFHNPSSELKEYSDDLYANMYNAYSKTIQEYFKYCSDSNGYWRFERLENVLDSSVYPNLHILTHPGWWQDEILSPFERVNRCIDGRSNATRTLYLNLLKKFNRKNIT